MGAPWLSTGRSIAYAIEDSISERHFYDSLGLGRPFGIDFDSGLGTLAQKTWGRKITRGFRIQVFGQTVAFAFEQHFVAEFDLRFNSEMALSKVVHTKIAIHR
jgi:hypothetical protein